MVCMGEQRLPVGEGSLARHPSLAQWEAGELLLGLRPEAMSLAGDAEATLQGTIIAVESLGHETLVYVDAGLSSIATDRVASMSVSNAGETSPPLVAVLRGYHPFEPGERLHLAVDPQQLYFFTPDGAALT